jgi:phosphohistidine phosphatase
MKTIYLVRHANAGWTNSNLPDFERTLSGKGRRDAAEMATRLLGKGVRPEIVISSPAVRALETAEIFGEIMGFDMDSVRMEYAIYSGDVDALHGIVAQLPQECQSAMLFGHNPNVSLFGSWLTGKPFGQMETCGVLRLDLSANDWEDADEGSVEMAWYLWPKSHQ